jgi:hypothetical protein
MMPNEEINKAVDIMLDSAVANSLRGVLSRKIVVERKGEQLGVREVLVKLLKVMRDEK